MPPSFEQEHIDHLIARSSELAREINHEYISLELITIALLEDSVVAEAIKRGGGDIKQISEDIYKALLDDTAKGAVSTANPRPTQKVINVLHRSVQQAANARRILVEPYHIMASVLSEEQTVSTWVMSNHKINRVTFIQNLNVQSPGTGNGVEIDPISGMPKPTPEQALSDYCVNLNEKAKDKDIDPLIGRGDEVTRTIQILSRRKKNNPLLVGDPGVGKTAIAEGLALKIINDDVPDYIKNSVIYSLDIGALVAGAKFRGDVEERLKAVLEGLEEVNKTNKAILFIDEIHTIIGAGATSGGSMDVSNLLKPALAAGKLRCIGSTTYNEFNKYFEKDVALKRRFQKVDVVEPTKEEATEIVRGLSTRFGEYHECEYTDEALVKAVELSSRYIHENKLPDKAIDVIDEAGAAQRLLSVADRSTVIDVNHIEEVIAVMARLPKDIKTNDRDQLKKLKPHLLNFVFGQDSAINELVTAVTVSRAGLRDINKTVGNYLFSGPTGVGKTEVAKQLARILGVEFVRFDMSEFMEKHAVAKLIGSPPGYVGHDDSDGQLIEAIDKHPHCVLLLDEIEKAHPDLFNILLQVMDNASLTGSRGKTVKFHNVILIMTTNAGSADAAKKAIGFGRECNDGAETDAVNKMFAPEFRNRLDAIIPFDSLAIETMKHIVDKFINELQVLLDDKSVIINVDEEARDWLSIKGYDPAYGARPLSRVIQEHIKAPMATELLFGSLVDGGMINVSVKDKKLHLVYS